jgi:16S rRNA (cytidine1402-2'-O)-methyltransferase
VTSDTPMKDGAHPSDGPAASKRGPRSGVAEPSKTLGKRWEKPDETAPDADGRDPVARALAGAAPAGLAIVATPIGNAADITLRALAVLRGADLIVCEDTRVSGKLMAMYGITTRRVAYNDHNADRIRPLIVGRLRRGERVALISDAGMPLVSDPGFKLVRDCLADQLPVTVVPGASAPLAALALSGLASDRFLFAGFLPNKSSARRDELAALVAVPATLIFFESARRLGDTLADMAAVLGDRPAAVARELTKLFEEVRRGSLAELAAHYAAAGPPRGEIVVLVGPPDATAIVPESGAGSLDALLRTALAGASLRDAAASVAAATGLKRRDVYARALALAAEGKDDS